MSDLEAYIREMQAKNEAAAKALSELAEENARLKERLRWWADVFEADGYVSSAEAMRRDAK